VPNHKLEINNRKQINAENLEKKFDAGLGDFIELLNSVGIGEKSKLIDSLDRLSEEIAAEHQKLKPLEL
jgi:hypothetical protein